MLSSAAVITVLQASGYALMAVGVGTASWIVISFLKPRARRRALLGMGCALGLAVGTIKIFWARGPANASAAPASAPQPPLAAASAAPATQPGDTTHAPTVARLDSQSPTSGADAKPHHLTAPAARPTTAQPALDQELADAYVDHTNGYSIRFPAGWSSTEYTGGDPWFIEVSDGKSGLISVGFSPFPASAGFDQLKPSQIEQHLAAQRHTTVQAHGRAVIDGHTCLWIKYTCPIKSSAGDQPMTVIHYYVPLHDGRMFQLRLAAAPDAFAKQARVLRKSAASIKLLPT